MDIVKQISQIVEEEREFSNDEIINILNAVGKHGDVIILKMMD